MIFERAVFALNRTIARALRLLLVFAVVVGGLFMFAQPVQADTAPPVIPPGNEYGEKDWCADPNRGNCNNPGNHIDYTCVQGDLRANGKVFIKDDPRCETCPDTWYDPSKCDWAWDYYTSTTCLVRFEVFRFYGTKSSPVQHKSHSRAFPRHDCKRGVVNEYFLFHAPHPHDAGVYGGAPFASSGMFTTTSWPISGTGSCPVGDDPAELAKFFGPASTFANEDEAANAKKVRATFGELHREVVSDLSTIGIPTQYANHFTNSKGLYTYPGDTVQTVRYPDGIPCSSGLDFVVKPAQPVRTYGVCWVPVVTSTTVKYRNSSTGEELWRIREDSRPEIDRAWMADPRNQGASGTTVDAYRRAIPSEYRDSNVPCYYGEGSVFNSNANTTPPPPATPQSSVTPNHLAYIYGSPDLELQIPVGAPTLSCGRQPCAAGTKIVNVTWDKPTVTVPSTGSWTACTQNNRTRCAYTLTAKKAANNALDVRFRGYKATPSDQSYTISFSGKALVQYVTQHEQSLSVCIGRNWTGLASKTVTGSRCSNVSISEADFDYQLQPITFPEGNTANIRVAGSKLTDH